MPVYHHYIPRFILRGFIPEDPSAPVSPVPKSKKQRQRAARKARKKGHPDPESISVFDLGSRSIKYVPIAKTFGELDFYQDGRNQEDVEHLEKQLCKLEGEAARVIRELHVAADHQSSFTLPRSDLQLLRKFIFLMHYRSSTTHKTYFQEDHPGNAPIRQWIRHLKKTKGYTTDKEIWLDGLRYYLFTKHSEILNLAKQYSKHETFGRIGETDVDISSNQWHALEYESFSNNYYLGIWRAHEDSEFVLGHDSYGVWEGTLAGSPRLYKLYVISPKITIVLKSNMSKGIPSAFEDSTLSDHPLGSPQIAYNHGQHVMGSGYPRPQDDFEVLQRHLQSPSSNNDQFTFRINELTVDQTYLVNQVILENLHADGLLVFSSRDAMLPTAQRYDTSERPFLKKNRQAIADLVRCLQSDASSNPPSPTPCTPSTPNSTPPPDPTLVRPHRPGLEDFMLPREFKTRFFNQYGPGRRFSTSDWGSEDLIFDFLLFNVLQDDIDFESDYDRAIFIHRNLPPLLFSVHPLVHVIAERMAQAKTIVEFMQEIPAAGQRGGFQAEFVPGTALKLVDSLGEDDSRHLLEMLSLHCGPFGWVTQQWEGEECTHSQKLLEQVTMMAYLELLLKVDPNLAASLCGSVTFIAVATPPPDPEQIHAIVVDGEEVDPLRDREAPKEEVGLRPRDPWPGPSTDNASSPTSSPSSESSRSPVPALLSDLLLGREVDADPVGDTFSAADRAFDDMLLDVLEGSIKFETEYERALYVHRHLPPLSNTRHPFVRSVAERISEVEGMIDRICADHQAQGGIVKSRFPPETPTKLVDSLSSEDTERLFTEIFLHFESMGFGWKGEKLDREYTLPMLHKILEQVTAIAYLKGLLQVDPNLVASLCSSVVFVEGVLQPDPSGGDDTKPRAADHDGNRALIPIRDAAGERKARFEGLPQGRVLSLKDCVPIPILLLGSAVSLAAAVASFPFYVLKCLIREWGVRGIAGAPPDPPRHDGRGVEFEIPAPVAFLMLAVALFYAGLYLTIAFLFGIPV